MTSKSNIQLTETLREEIKVALKALCVQEHSSPGKQLLKGMHERITLACPYCGDSHDDHTKKRGNMYWDTLQYHCYNCSHHTNVHTLLKDFGIKFNSSEDTFTVIDYIQQNKTKVNSEDTLKHAVMSSVEEHAITLDDFKRAFRAKPIVPGDWVWFQLKDRLLHNRLEEFLYTEKGHRLWILNMTNTGKVMGAQTRKMKGYGSRYLTYDLSKLYSEMGKPLEVDPVLLGNMNKASTLFGIMQINFQRPVTLFEGPLDAKFMHNSIALATAGRTTDEFDEMATVRYMFDNDKTGKAKMIQKLKKGKAVFMWSKFLADNNLDKYNIKDLNELMSKCFELKSNAHKQLNNYFTSEQLDLWYL
ncbi:hypothetical protein OAC86_00370 [bacterium]|jgi:hypothetical protein|nr:hypothetical protein [bacterium]MDB9899979.1 hypothetical protein [bacterium]|tara:strand:- start:2977 stop:4053 length:1077 start_codon:yes stop_codon:yes gene_type:complete